MNNKRVVILDYGCGNVRSVFNAFRTLKCDVKITNECQNIQDATHIILPGVGAFAECKTGLYNFNLVELLQKEVIEKGKPFLGICVGMQALATLGKEFGEHQGLDWITGVVDKIDTAESKLRLPHIGWNELSIIKSNPLFEGIEPGTTFYFVHSFQFRPKDDSVISSFCDYGVQVTASVQRDNIFGVQFHPEKSQSAGIRLLKNFTRIN